MALENDQPPGEHPGLAPREPQESDLAALGRHLNAVGAKYLVVGGFAMMAAGYARSTMDVDLLIATDAENEKRVLKALEFLPDRAAAQVQAGEIDRYAVVRVADEIVVDLMKTACGIDYQQAAPEIVLREIQGVSIPFASPRLLWRMKVATHREKDAPDLLFLRYYFEQRGESPPSN